MRTSLLAVFLTVILLAGETLHAHDLGVARVEISMLDETSFSVGAKLSAQLDFVDPVLPGGCEIFVGGSRDAGSRSRWHHWLINCRDRVDEGELKLDWGLQGALVEFQAREGQTMQQYLTAQEGVIVVKLGELAQDRLPATAQAFQYPESGFVHILVGLDHLMFVALLTFLARSRELLKLVTAFTPGRSLTLGLAVLGWSRIPIPPVEALIALSIAFLARNVLLGSWRPRDGLVLVLIFGLIHGLGFASVMDVQGLAGNDLLLALFFFNLGIEAGQVVFIAVLLSFGELSARLTTKSEAIGRAAVQFVGVFSGFLVIERTLLIILN